MCIDRRCPIILGLSCGHFSVSFLSDMLLSIFLSLSFPLFSYPSPPPPAACIAARAGILNRMVSTNPFRCTTRGGNSILQKPTGCGIGVDAINAQLRSFDGALSSLLDGCDQEGFPGRVPTDNTPKKDGCDRAVHYIEEWAVLTDCKDQKCVHVT